MLYKTLTKVTRVRVENGHRREGHVLGNECI